MAWEGGQGPEEISFRVGVHNTGLHIGTYICIIHLFSHSPPMNYSCKLKETIKLKKQTFLIFIFISVSS